MPPVVPLVPRLTFIDLMTAYVLCHNKRQFRNLAGPSRNHRQPLQAWLLPPGMAEAFSLLPGPLQLPDGLRQLFYAS
jgi:hypothetical protein